MNNNKKKIVVVLGAGRSGTSLTMQVASKLGLQTSPRLTSKSKTNLKGGWEDREILEISRSILGYFSRNSAYLSYLPMPEQWVSDSFVIKQKEILSSILTKQLNEAKGVWGFKEPVTAKLLPLWKLIFTELSIDPIFLLSVRNPRNVALSFKSAYGIPVEIAELIWISRYLDAILHTNADFTVLNYDQWFMDTEKQEFILFNAISDDASLYEKFSGCANSVIDKKLYTAKSNLPETFFPQTNDLYKLICNYDNLSFQGRELELVREAEKIYESIKYFETAAYSVDFVSRDNKRLRRIAFKKRYVIERRQELVLEKHEIVAGVASFKKRKEIFKTTIESILPQIDHLYAYLNRYDDVPDYLIHSKITVFRSQDYDDLSANGKIFILDKLHSCYFFALDDDILYPPDYVKRMISCLNKYNNKVGVVVHGSIFPKQVKWYFERYSLYPFQHALEQDKFVTLIGSGTFAFHTDTLKTKFTDFYGKVMVDLKFSILAKQQRVPLVCISRPKLWLKALTKGEGLYQQFYGKKTHHTDECIKHNPWGYKTFQSIIKPFIDENFPNLTKMTINELNMDEDLIKSFETGDPPANWSETELYKQKNSDGDAVLNPIQTMRRKDREINRKDELILSLRASPTYQIGQLFVKAIKKPGKNTLYLPLYLVKIVMGSFYSSKSKFKNS